MYFETVSKGNICNKNVLEGWSLGDTEKSRKATL